MTKPTEHLTNLKYTRSLYQWTDFETLAQLVEVLMIWSLTILVQ